MPQNKPKILYIVTQPEWGGAQRYIYDLAKAMREDFEVVVAAGQSSFAKASEDRPNEPPVLLRKCEKKEIKTRRLKYLCREINPVKDILAIFEIIKLIKDEKPDIIHLNSSKTGVIGSISCFLLSAFGFQRPRAVYTVHGWVFLEPLGFIRRFIYLLMEWFAGQLRDATIVLSEKEKNISLKFRISKPKNTFLIHHGIKPPEFIARESVRQQFGIKNNEFAIVTIANFYPSKGLQYLIEAAHLLNYQLRITNYKLLIIGEGAERKILESLTEKHNLGNKVFLLGAISKAQKYLKGFDLFVLPSLKEGFPYVIIEAMHAGLPIIATSVGGIPEIITNRKNGILVPPKNPKILAEKINELIKNYKFAEQLGMRAIITAQEKFTIDEMIEKTKEVYLTLL